MNTPIHLIGLFLMCAMLDSLCAQHTLDDAFLDTDILSSQDDLLHDGQLYSNWLNVLDTLACLSSEDMDQIKSFLSEEIPESPYELQIITSIPMQRISCAIRGLLKHQLTSLPNTHEISHSLSVVTSINPSQDSFKLTDLDLLLRFSSTPSDKIKLFMSFEKDQQESFFTKAKGPEHVGAYLQWKPSMNVIEDVIIGDHRFSMGQGLIFNNFYRKGLGFGQLQIPKYGLKRLASYQSLDENSARRGIGISSRYHKNIVHSASFSLRQLDASIDSVTNEITSFTTDGIHVSANQIKKKDAAPTWSVASSLEYTSRYTNIALNFIFQEWQNDIAPLSRLYASGRIQGNRYLNGSLSFDFFFKNTNVYGEVSFDHYKTPNGILGLLFTPHKSHSFSCVGRYLSPFFTSPFIQTLAHSTTNNETGIFFGYQAQLHSKLSLTLNLDHRIQTWWSYLNSPYRESDEIRLSLRLAERRNYDLSFSFSLLARQKDIRISNLPITKMENRWQYRIHYVKTLGRGVEWRSRAQVNRYGFLQNSVSWMVYQELKFKPVGSSFSITSRIARYAIQNFDSRIYTYEVRAGNRFAFPAFNGNGYRFFINLKYTWKQFRIGLYLGTQSETSTNSNMSLSLRWKV